MKSGNKLTIMPSSAFAQQATSHTNRYRQHIFIWQAPFLPVSTGGEGHNRPADSAGTCVARYALARCAFPPLRSRRAGMSLPWCRGSTMRLRSVWTTGDRRQAEAGTRRRRSCGVVWKRMTVRRRAVWEMSCHPSGTLGDERPACSSMTGSMSPVFETRISLSGCFFLCPLSRQYTRGPGEFTPHNEAFTGRFHCGDSSPVRLYNVIAENQFRL